MPINATPMLLLTEVIKTIPAPMNGIPAAKIAL